MRLAAVALLGSLSILPHNGCDRAKKHSTEAQAPSFVIPEDRPKFKQLTVAELLACNRRSIFHGTVEQAPHPKPLDLSSTYRSVDQMSDGEDGWIMALDSKNGNLLVRKHMSVLPIRGDMYIGGYFPATADIHIMKARYGILVDCETPAYVIQSDDADEGYYLPVVGQFRSTRKDAAR